jgi:hypothetical protein
MDITIAQETCLTCKVSFWVTTEHQKKLIKRRESFFCPNGHEQHYIGETCEQKLVRMERKLKDEECVSGCLRRSNSAYRGIITKMKNKQESEL